jgi:hypothetical protein
VKHRDNVASFYFYRCLPEGTNSAVLFMVTLSINYEKLFKVFETLSEKSASFGGGGVGYLNGIYFGSYDLTLPHPFHLIFADYRTIRRYTV